MRANQCALALVAGICTVVGSTSVFAQDPPWRHEIRRLDVPGAPDKQIVVELNEFKPGDGLDRHSHPGIEQGYVIQGAMVQQPAGVTLRLISPVLPYAGAVVVEPNLEDAYLLTVGAKFAA